jgi:hypothetical protein
MYLYNITYLVPHAIAERWLTWMKEEHVPEMLSSGLFTHHRIMQLVDVDETEGLTFAFQFYTETEFHYKKYMTDFAPSLRAKANQQWGDQVVGFRTVMKSVQ